NRLYFGDGNKFEQRPMGDRVANTGWSWGATSFDADNDGDTDLFIANGHKSRESVKDYERQFWCHDIYHGTSESNPAMEVYINGRSSRLYGAGHSYGGYEKNRLLLNRENKSLDDVAFLMNASHEIDSRNVASGDIDGDGRLDLIFTHFSVWPEPETQGLLMALNLWPGDNRWVGFRLARSADCPSLNGTKIRLRAGGRDQWRVIVNGDSYRSQHAPIAHFGLGQAAAEFVEIHWPNGQTTRIDEPPHGQYHAVQAVTAPAE
ncbi:MAG: CRTAC1 family protein, partial [Verrucomicrobia bacterium]|nr:CRTAC1 family protein [Verrucomicrobiota bacterium]